MATQYKLLGNLAAVFAVVKKKDIIENFFLRVLDNFLFTVCSAFAWLQVWVAVRSGVLEFVVCLFE